MVWKQNGSLRKSIWEQMKKYEYRWDIIVNLLMILCICKRMPYFLEIYAEIFRDRML